MNLLVISGQPATGKTQFIEIIKKQFDIVVVSKDDIKEILFETIGVEDLDLSIRQSAAAMGIMFYVMDSMAQQSGCLVLEANFRSTHQQSLKSFVDKNRGTRLMQIHFMADADVIERRLDARATSGMRHEGHLFNLDKNNAETLNARPSDNEVLNLPGECTKIDTTHPSDKMYDEALSAIKQFVEDTVA